MPSGSHLPVIVVLDNVHSLYNTGAFFRTADACAVERLMDLCKWTPRWPVCLVFGHERHGVAPNLDGPFDVSVRVPMFGEKRSRTTQPRPASSSTSCCAAGCELLLEPRTSETRVPASDLWPLVSDPWPPNL